MSQAKKHAISLIRKLPDDCSLEDIRYQLYVHERIEAGMKALAEGRTVSLEEAERRMATWLKSYGRNSADSGSKKPSATSPKGTGKKRPVSQPKLL
jgi:hypothetical protein